MKDTKTVHRCTWAGNDPLMQAYHDEEWGVPQHDSRALWEMLMLEGFQAGLAWITVLRKREAFRKAFGEAGLEHFIRNEEISWSEATGEFRGFEIVR